MMEALKSLISRYSFEYDDREPEYSFTTPFVGSFELINLDLSFWVVCFIFLTIQSIINAGVASVVFKFIVQQQGKIHTYIIGYGLVCPILLCGPLYLFSAFHFTNVTFMLCLCGAVPNLLLLRVIEAMHGMLPSFAKESAGMFALYYSATLQVKIDNKTNRPVPFTRKIFISKVLKFLSVFLQTSVLYSVLMPVGYSVAPHRPIHSLLDLYHWGNILNAFSMASLTSLVLDGKNPPMDFCMK